MSRYLYYTSVGNSIADTKQLKLNSLSELLNNENGLDVSINSEFPIGLFGNPDDVLTIKGAKTLIEQFKSVNAKKLDITIPYRSIDYNGFDEFKSLNLTFNTDTDNHIEAHSVYDFVSDFFYDFSLYKFIIYCLENNYTDLIEHNITYLFSHNESKTKQYRLLEDKDGTWAIRGITSTGYKNYDNNIILYLSLLSLHKYSVDHNKEYHITHARIADSYINVYLEQNSAHHINGVGDVYLGLAISNGEIRNRMFKLELRYRIVSDDKINSFSAIYDTPLFSIKHSMILTTINAQLQKVDTLSAYEQTILQFINDVHLENDLTSDKVYSIVRGLLGEIERCSDITKSTRDSFRAAETEQLINNTYSLMELFGKLSNITCDVDEKIYIERIFNKVIKDMFR